MGYISHTRTILSFNLQFCLPGTVKVSFPPNTLLAYVPTHLEAKEHVSVNWLRKE
ncbi:elongator complex protein [Sesbania bispinosa]|nr:elongator complex protein [Sesbania bispinosa]